MPIVLCATLLAQGLESWTDGVRVGPVADGPHHSIHAYFNACPESPDGRWVLYYASTAEDGHSGELRIRERASGDERVVARDIVTEDAHRAACQQWVSGGRTVVYHTVTPEDRWHVMAVDVPDGTPRLLAKDRQLGFGPPLKDVVPLYGPHWAPGAHRDLELLDVRSGEIRKTSLTAEALRAAYPDWVGKTFGDRPISIFFPVLGPDLRRVFFKAATPAGGDFRSKKASHRAGLLCYDLQDSRFLSLTERWGHPAWHPDGRRILEYGGIFIDGTTGAAAKIPNFPPTQGAYHPACSPDGRLFALDSMAEKFGGPPGSWQILVGEAATGESPGSA